MSRHDKDSVTGVVRGKLERLDSYQRRHPALGVPIAVVRKFVEDESTSRAVQIAFGRSSRFPLLLIFVTLLGYFLPSSLQCDVFGRVTSFFPLLSTNSIGQLDIPATDADYRAYDAYAKERTYHHDEGVHTEFPRHDPDDG